MAMPSSSGSHPGSECLGAGRPGWKERLSGEDHERIGLLEPGYAPASSWDPLLVPRGPAPGDMLAPERFTRRQCDAHWRVVPAFAEFRELFELRDTERPARLKEIRAQHRGSVSRFLVSDAFVQVVAAARRRCGGDGGYDDCMRVLRPLRAAQDEIDRVVLAQKCLYNRARPFQLFPELAPPFCPAHPGYPSGHATGAHALAFLLDAAMSVPGDPHAAERSAAAELATRIARNRELAGVHFSSDTRAGVELARELVREILQHPGMKAKLAQARALLTPA
jgi:hypothetical protein